MTGITAVLERIQDTFAGIFLICVVMILYHWKPRDNPVGWWIGMSISALVMNWLIAWHLGGAAR